MTNVLIDIPLWKSTCFKNFIYIKHFPSKFSFVVFVFLTDLEGQRKAYDGITSKRHEASNGAMVAS